MDAPNRFQEFQLGFENSSGFGGTDESVGRSMREEGGWFETGNYAGI